jgi:hypothetical protein
LSNHCTDQPVNPYSCVFLLSAVCSFMHTCRLLLVSLKKKNTYYMKKKWISSTNPEISKNCRILLHCNHMTGQTTARNSTAHSPITRDPQLSESSYTRGQWHKFRLVAQERLLNAVQNETELSAQLDTTPSFHEFYCYTSKKLHNTRRINYCGFGHHQLLCFYLKQHFGDSVSILR